MIQYAVNLDDLNRKCNELITTWLVLPVRGKTVSIKGDLAVVLDCNAKLAAAIVEVIHMKRKRYEVCCYEKRDGQDWTVIT